MLNFNEKNSPEGGYFVARTTKFIEDLIGRRLSNNFEGKRINVASADDSGFGLLILNLSNPEAPNRSTRFLPIAYKKKWLNGQHQRMNSSLSFTLKPAFRIFSSNFF